MDFDLTTGAEGLVSGVTSVTLKKWREARLRRKEERVNASKAAQEAGKAPEWP